MSVDALVIVNVRRDDMGRNLQRVLPLLVCCIASIAPDYDHLASIISGQPVKGTLHSSIALLVCLGLLVTFSCGYVALVLRER